MGSYFKGGGEGAAAGEEGNIHALVESCAHNDDIGPLVRLVFEAQSLADSPTTIAADGQQMVSIICGALRAVADEQGATIDEVCHSSATSIAETVAELERMHAAVDEVRSALLGANGSMQDVGRTLVDNVQAVNRLAETEDSLQQASAAVRAAQGVLEQCLAAGQLIHEHQLYPALCMLDKIRRKHLSALLGMLSNKGSLSSIRRSTAGGQAPAAKRLTGRDLEHLQQLHTFFSGLVDDMTAAVQRLALQGFNQWLVSMRAHAREVGLQAIQAAAGERALEEDLSSERKALLAALTGPGHRSVRDVAAGLVQAPFRQELLREAAADQEVRAAAEKQSAGGSSGALSALAASGLRELLRRSSKRKGSSGSVGSAAAAHSSADAPLQRTSLGAWGEAEELPDLDSLYPGEPDRAIKALVHHQKQRWGYSTGGAPAASASAAAAAAAGLSSWRSNIGEGGEHRHITSLLDVDMAGCHAAVHVAKSLGQLEAFRQHYLEQRRLQIATDLQAPANFLETYQGYLSQVTGFFVLESYVQRVTDGLVGPPEGALLWGSALRGLRPTLEASLQGIASAHQLLLVKDFCLLACTALERAGYQVGPVAEVLLATQGRYHDLLSSQLQEQLAAAVEADVLGELEVATEAQHRSLVDEYGLPWQLDGAGRAAAGRRTQLGPGGVPPLPYTAPFTSCVPGVLSLVRRYVADSLSYLRGLYTPAELLPAVLHQRDRMLSKVLVDVMSAKARSVGSEEMMRECMKVAANAWALSQSLDALDEWTMQQARPDTAGSAAAAAAAAQAASGQSVAAKLARARNRKAAVASGALSSSVKSALATLQESSERDVLRNLTGRIEQLLQGSRKGNWIPAERLPAAQSAWVDALLSYLQETFETGVKLLPRSSMVRLMEQALRVTASTAMVAFRHDGGVPAFNLYAIERLGINVATIERFASRWGVSSLAEELAEPKQMCSLLLSTNKMADVLAPDKRRALYPALDLQLVVVALDKFREVPYQYRAHPQWPSKDDAEHAHKHLKQQLKQQPATPPAGAGAGGGAGGGGGS